MLGGGAHCLGDAEVHDEGMAAGQHDVVGLDIPVHDALPVRVGQRIEDVAKNPGRVGGRERPFTRQTCPQGLPFDVRHDAVEKARGLPRIDQRQDVGMLQVGRDGDFAEEPLGAEGGGDLRAHHLDGNRAIMLEVTGQVHSGHASGTELALDRVPPG